MGTKSQPPSGMRPGTGISAKPLLAGLGSALSISFLVLASTAAMGPMLQQIPPEAAAMVGLTLSVVASLGAVLVGGFVAGLLSTNSGALNGALVAVLVSLILGLMLLTIAEVVPADQWTAAIIGVVAQIGVGAFGGHLAEAYRPPQRD